MIYDGDVDFTNMSKENFLKVDGANKYDKLRKSLSAEVKSKIINHIGNHFNGTNIGGEIFHMKKLYGGKVYFSDADVSWGTFNLKKPFIIVTDKYNYETTVENIASSLIVHEWYTHGVLQYTDDNRKHHIAYLNVLQISPFSRKTTEVYNYFNLKAYSNYLYEETGQNFYLPEITDIYKY